VKSVSLAGPEKALDWLEIMKSQGKVHTFKKASDQECRDRIVSGRDVDFLRCIPAQVTKDNTCRARCSAASGAANFCVAFCILSWAALSPAKDTYNIISMASIYLQLSVHAIHNPLCQSRESPALNSTQFKHSTPEKEIAISSSTSFKIP